MDMVRTRQLYIALLCLLTIPAVAQVQTDRGFDLQIKQLSSISDKQLKYPKAVGRYYRQNNLKPVWTGNLKSESPTWKAMLILDCVLQFGLSHADYHPDQLKYSLLQDLQENPAKVSDAAKAKFDVMLTDAMISLINDLHYGKLNPIYGSKRLDVGLGIPLVAEDALRDMLKGPDIYAAIFNVQPKSKAYADLQGWMSKWKGQYTGDCYEVPEADVRRVAINMERLRWAAIDDTQAYLQVNIPTYQLTYHTVDSDRYFKVIVGKQGTPTPQVQTRVTHIVIAPEKRLGCDNSYGSVLFRTADQYDFYLQDTPDKQIFKHVKRAIGTPCVALDGASDLAQALLNVDGQPGSAKQLVKNLTKLKYQLFMLTRPVSLSVTYITCALKDGELVVYDDPYQLDRPLQTAFYQRADRSSVH
ncbi:hypothetical protein GCM10028827_11510 [Mucilaginibacter myungsuensis]